MPASRADDPCGCAPVQRGCASIGKLWSQFVRLTRFSTMRSPSLVARSVWKQRPASTQSARAPEVRITFAHFVISVRM